MLSEYDWSLFWLRFVSFRFFFFFSDEILRSDATLKELRIGVDVLDDLDTAVDRIVDTDADQLRAVRDRLRSCVERINELAHLRALVARRKAIKYDTSNNEHETLLLALWKALKRDEPLVARVTRQWGAIGFQGHDPATDFRGMGVLGLEQLHFFASRHTAEATHALELSLGDGSPLSGFPFAITGINVTALMVNALNEGRLDRELLLRGVDREQFDLLYAQTLATFAREYTASKPDNIASFPPFFAAFSQRLESVVNSADH